MKFNKKLFEDLKSKRFDDFYLYALLEKALIGEPLLPMELKMLLNKGIVDFEFIKVDGVTKRKARATRQIEYVPQRNMPHGGYVSPKIIPWYDLQKQAWRSVSKLRTKEIVKLPSEDDNEVHVQIRDKEFIKSPKYTKEKYDEIKRLRDKGLTMTQIARKLGYASHSDISKIIKKFEPDTPKEQKPRLKAKSFIPTKQVSNQTTNDDFVEVDNDDTEIKDQNSQEVNNDVNVEQNNQVQPQEITKEEIESSTPTNTVSTFKSNDENVVEDTSTNGVDASIN